MIKIKLEFYIKNRVQLNGSNFNILTVLVFGVIFTSLLALIALPYSIEELEKA